MRYERTRQLQQRGLTALLSRVDCRPTVQTPSVSVFGLSLLETKKWDVDFQWFLFLIWKSLRIEILSFFCPPVASISQLLRIRSQDGSDCQKQSVIVMQSRLRQLCFRPNWPVKRMCRQQRRSVYRADFQELTNFVAGIFIDKCFRGFSRWLRRVNSGSVGGLSLGIVTRYCVCECLEFRNVDLSQLMFTLETNQPVK